ncbi:MAG: DUF4402 domain-containing protein [bacterium]|nr:DUF4402 domain-containing protein [bacterium]
MFAALLLLPADIFAGSKKSQIEEQASLRFGNVMAASTAQTVTISAEDSGAAVFIVTGEPNRLVALSVKPRSEVQLKNGGARIELNQVVFGGSVTDRGGQATARLDAKGELNNVRIGGTVAIPPLSASGTYVGQLRLEVEVEDD